MAADKTVLDLLLLNIKDNVDIPIEKDLEIEPWGKCLRKMPRTTMKLKNIVNGVLYIKKDYFRKRRNLDKHQNVSIKIFLVPLL